MKTRIWITAALLLCSLAQGAQAQYQDKFIFFDGPYELLQMRARSAEKPYFVYLYANWSMAAKNINDNVFESRYVTEYAQENYIGLKLDGESTITDGAMLAELHNAIYLPVVIFFTPQGKEVDRVYGEIDAEQFLNKLRQHADATGEPEPLSEDDLLDEGKPAAGEFLFKVSAKKQRFRGYAVQLGAYTDYEHCFRKILELEEKYYHKNVLLHVVNETPDRTVYKIVLGPFGSEEQAEAYQRALAKRGKNFQGVVVDLSEI